MTQPFEKHAHLAESIEGLTLFAIQPIIWNNHLAQINKLALDFEKAIAMLNGLAHEMKLSEVERNTIQLFIQSLNNTNYDTRDDNAK